MEPPREADTARTAAEMEEEDDDAEESQVRRSCPCWKTEL